MTHTHIIYKYMYYNIQLLPSYEVNIESCQPEDGCVLIENTDTYLSNVKRENRQNRKALCFYQS